MENMENTMAVLRKLSQQLSLDGHREISFIDVVDALFMLWEEKKGMDYVHDLYDEPIELESTFRMLRQFNFIEFQKLVRIRGKLFETIFDEEIETDETSNLLWRITRYHNGLLEFIPHLYNATLNLRLDIRNGACLCKQRFMMRVPLEELLEIRERMESKLRDEMPPIYIN
jgi:hypothetical protein